MSVNGSRYLTKISRVVPALLGAGLAGLACQKDAVVDQRVITLYTLADPPTTPQAAAQCAVPTTAYALYSAAGDFEPDPSSPPQEGRLLSTLMPELDALPQATRQLSLDVQLGTGHWRGFGSVPSSGDVGVLLWPIGHECALSKSVDALRAGSTLTPYDDHHALVTGGAGAPSFVVDFSTGSVEQIAHAQEITLTRTNATGTAFGDGAGVVIAGGRYANDPINSAEIYDAKYGSFTGETIDLALNRADQGATLLADGDVLLVGGVGEDGAPYHSMQTIDPVKKHATVAGLAALAAARAKPTVLRLANGEVLVLGGTGSDGKPASTIEWFSKDATQATGAAGIASSTHQAFVALPGGGALAVISPDTPGPTTTFVITPDHQVEQAASIASLLPASNVRLFDGANGAPLLWTGSGWFRWSPWQGTFVPFSEATPVDGTTTASGPSPDAITANVDAGLAIWLENSGINEGRVLGLRFDARGIYSTDVKTLLATDTISIAPDRLLTGASPDGSGSTLRFESGSGLTLSKNSAAVIADATFAEFSLDYDTVQLGSPVVFLRDAAGDDDSIGAGADAVTCKVPESAHVHVERSGQTISVTDAAGNVTRCSASIAASSRVSIGFRGRANGAPVTVRNVVIRR